MLQGLFHSLLLTLLHFSRQWLKTNEAGRKVCTAVCNWTGANVLTGKGSLVLLSALLALNHHTGVVSVCFTCQCLIMPCGARQLQQERMNSPSFLPFPPSLSRGSQVGLCLGSGGLELPVLSTKMSQGFSMVVSVALGAQGQKGAASFVPIFSVFPISMPVVWSWQWDTEFMPWDNTGIARKLRPRSSSAI